MNKIELSQGAYLRILSMVLHEFDINWFDVGISKTSIRCLYKDDDKWIIKDYLGVSEREEGTIVLPKQDSMEDICLGVIKYVSYDTDEENRLTDYFQKKVKGQKEELENTRPLPSFLKHEGLTEESDLPAVYYHEWEDIACYLSGYETLKEISEIYGQIKPCRCGGKVELHEYTGMGELDYIINCRECTRSLSRGVYDSLDVSDKDSFDDALLNALINDWNNHIEQWDIDRMRETEISKSEIKSTDFSWIKYHTNNIASGPIEGQYALLIYKGYEGELCACKWTVEYQEEEISPGCSSSDSKIEAYNLFRKEMSELKGVLHYPPAAINANCTDDEKGYITFKSAGLFDKGEFIRSYKTLEDAKIGALSRCGWRLNRDNLIKVKEYGDITAEELCAKFSESDR